MPRVRASDPRGKGDPGGARQPERDHPARGAGRRALPRGEPEAGRRAPPGEEEEEETREEGTSPHGTTLCVIHKLLY